MTDKAKSKDTFVNPYHFIPLEQDCTERKEFRTDLRDESQDSDSTLNTGWIECEIDTLTPIFTPNTSNKKFFETSDKEEYLSYDFYSYADLGGKRKTEMNVPVIPGSSIRGVIRSAFEVLTNSCLSAITDDARLFKRFTIPPYKRGGVIEKRGNRWFLEPCSVSNKGEADGRMTFMFIGERGINGKHSRKYFTIDPVSETIPLTDSDISRFRYLVESYRDERINKHLSEGHTGYKKIDLKSLDRVLVFYEKKAGRLYISPAQIGKEVFHKQLSDILPIPYKPCTSLKQLCPTCLLFGIAGKSDALASRVSFSDAKLLSIPDDLKKVYESPGILQELASPKPSATEFYLKRQKPKGEHDLWNYDYAGKVQEEGGNKKVVYDDINKYSPCIQGRKFYWHHEKMKPYVHPNTATKRNVMIRPVIKGVKFGFRITYKNITDMELGRLLWTLSFGNSQTHAHKIGMGKPLGLGSVRISFSKVINRVILSTDTLVYELTDQTNAFRDYLQGMEDYLGCSKEVLDAYLLIHDFENCLKNIQYPTNMNKEGKHYEWFSSNKTDSVINQHLEPLNSGSIELEKYD